MSSANSNNPVRRQWDRFAGLPGGQWLFSFSLGRLAPYTGSIRPRVLELRNGFARVGMKDRRAVRNHLNSIHAVALVNLAEVTSGLALHYGLPGHARAILTGLSIEYLKKARGLLVAEATAPLVSGDTREEIEMETSIQDAAGDIVAKAKARWLVGPREERGGSGDRAGEVEAEAG
jgi:acyl-coenzyme A thioesterase PaaI-like protein